MKKLFFDLFPVILFFIVFKYAGIYAATAAAIVATILQVIWVKYHHGKVDGMLWVSFGIIVVMGGATLLLHDETFIKWKPTILYWVFSGSLLFSRALLGKNLMRTLLDEKIELPDAVWGKLDIAWATFFAVLGGINLYVAFHYSTEQWVNFKLFGVTGLLMVFVLAQSFFLSKHIKPD